MAVPNPERELTRLRKALGKALPPITLVSGPAAFFRAEAMDALVDAVPDSADVRVIAGDQQTDGQELFDLCGASLFGRGCVLVVRRGEAWLKEHGAGLVELLPRIAKGCALVVEATKVDKRTKLGKALVAGAEAFEFRGLYTEPYDKTRSPLEAEMVSWLQDRGKRGGLPMHAEAALLLMHTVGTDPAECVGEIERLAAQREGGGGPVSAEQIAPLLNCGFESTPFELAEAVLDLDRARAERSLQAMYDRGIRGKDGDSVDRGGLFPFITSWLYQSLAKAYEGRFMLDRGSSIRDVTRALGVRVFVDRFERQVQRNDLQRLRRGLLCLHEAQRELRTTGEDPAWLLRRFLVRYFERPAA